MSGQQAGTAIGFVAGFFLPGGPQVWAGIGGMVGGAIDPTKVQGPRLSDGMTVTALDGIPNPWGFGTFAVGANVINTFDLEEHKHTDDGKGSGVEQETFTYTRSYALGICRGKRNSDGTYSPIAGILRATHNGKVVYNTQPDATGEQLANNAKFLQNHKFYLGGDAQLPDPTLESYMDPGNVSAYCGQVYMVATDEDQTESRGAIGTWEFVVAMEGEIVPDVLGYAAGFYGRFGNSLFPLLDDERHYELTGFMWNVNGAGGGVDSFTAGTISEIKAHFANHLGGSRSFSQFLGYSASTSPIGAYAGDPDFGGFGYSGHEPQPDVALNESLYLVYHDESPSTFITNADCSMPVGIVNGQFDNAGNKVAVIEEGTPGWFTKQGYCIPPGEPYVTGAMPALYIRVARKRTAPSNVPTDGSQAIPDAPGFYVSPSGEVFNIPDYDEATGATFKVLSIIPESTEVDGRDQYAYFEFGPALISTDPLYSDQAFWEAAYADAVDAGNLPSGWVYNVDYPSITNVVWREVSTSTPPLYEESVPLAAIVSEVCRRSGLDDDDFDVSQLTDLVGGFKVAVEATGESVISSLMPAFFFDCGEWDDKLRFVKRGGDAVFALTVDDLAERDGPVIEETEAQEVELLRKVMVRAMDPAAGYVETTQAAERRSSTVAAKGEQTLALPVVMDKDTQAQVADKRIKVAWSENRRFKWALPYTRPELTPTDVGTITDRQGRIQRVQLMEMTEDSGLIQIEEAKLTRQSTYTSNVEGVTHAPPTDTSPGLIGPTYGVVMNLPSLRTQDNVPGVYLAACGYLPGWRATAVYMSPDGGDSFAQVATIAQPSRMGVLTTDASAGGEPISVFMNSGEISSITDAQLAARGNAWAITSNFGTPSAVSEVGQSKTATPDSEGGYDLTENVRGGLGTTPSAHSEGDPFVMLSSVYFLPLDISLSGKTLLFKFVSYGTSPDDAAEIEFLFNPLFTSVVIDAFRDEDGVAYTDENGETYYSETIT